ncbi:pyridoxamine 5'-phosphate oxidase family protein [Streptomyces hydrogenans]|uniref:pyridoxamine 5'-phosphate oxidase family protein n=1 Tax=Streptomyces hydrogenans TaxID=1873719 RepID=UPI00381F3245
MSRNTAATAPDATATETAAEAAPATTRNDGPAPRALTDAELSLLLSGQQFGVLASVRSTGHPHLSTVLYAWDAEERVLRVSSTADRLKVRQLRRDPHASLHVSGPDVWSFAVAEGEAEILDPADGAAPGEKPLPDRRVTIALRVTRLYGTALDIRSQN